MKIEIEYVDGRWLIRHPGPSYYGGVSYGFSTEKARILNTFGELVVYLREILGVKE